MKLAVVGVTGLVGQMMVNVLTERAFPVDQLIGVASRKSVGKTFKFRDQEIVIIDHPDAIREKPDIALFSAGSETSLKWAKAYANAGIRVIDNSSAWRMEKGIPLVVPEVNASILSPSDYLIANPNCSTIQLVVVLAPLHRRFHVSRVVISTYQSVTGTGMKGIRQLDNERQGILGEMAYPYPIDLNLFPHGGAFEANGYTSEEMKLVNESRKILDDPGMSISPTIVRVPVKGGHAESVNLTFAQPFNLHEIIELLSHSQGVVVQDDVQNNIYPMPLWAEGKDDVFVGRVRRDEWHPNSLNLFIVSDNLRKGAATNAIQIAEYLVSLLD